MRVGTIGSRTQGSSRTEWWFGSSPYITAAGNDSNGYFTNGRHLFSKSYLVWL